MPHRAPHDLAQHIAAPFVRGDDAVGNQERGGPRVVGDHPHRDVAFGIGSVGDAGQLADALQERHEEIGVVVRVFLLHHRGDALEPHSGVDRGRGQRGQRAVGAALELHEHVVPDLDLRVVAGAADVVDLRAAAARAGVAHLPEVIVGSELENAIGRHEPAPDVVGLIVARNARFAFEHRHHQAIRRQLPDLGQQRPGEFDRLGFEVVAKRKVAEHLEEGVMAQRRSDVVEVVVLAAHAHDLLRRRGARVVAPFAAEEDVLELVHAGIGEQQASDRRPAPAVSSTPLDGRFSRNTSGKTRGSRWRSSVPILTDGNNRRADSNPSGQRGRRTCKYAARAAGFSAVVALIVWQRRFRALAKNRQDSVAFEALTEEKPKQPLKFLLIGDAIAAAQTFVECCGEQRVGIELTVDVLDRAVRGRRRDAGALDAAVDPEPAATVQGHFGARDGFSDPYIVNRALRFEAGNRDVDVFRKMSPADQALTDLRF